MGFPGFITGSASFAETTAFDEFFDTTQKNTTSNGWVTYDIFVTPEEKESGFFNISWSVDYGQSDKEKQVGVQVQWRPGTSGGWTTLSDTREAVSVDNTFNLQSGFRIITLNADDEISVRIRWGQTDDGGTGRLKNVGLNIFKVGELP